MRSKQSAVEGREILVYPTGQWRFLGPGGVIDDRYREGAWNVAVIPREIDPRIGAAREGCLYRVQYNAVDFRPPWQGAWHSWSGTLAIVRDHARRRELGRIARVESNRQVTRKAGS